MRKEETSEKDTMDTMDVDRCTTQVEVEGSNQNIWMVSDSRLLFQAVLRDILQTAQRS